METPKTALLGRTLDEIQQIVRNLGMPKFAAKQIASWLYDKKVETNRRDDQFVIKASRSVERRV